MAEPCWSVGTLRHRLAQSPLFPEPSLPRGHTVRVPPSVVTGAPVQEQSDFPEGSPDPQALPWPCPSHLAAGGTHCPGSVLEAVGAAAGHSEVLGRTEAWVVPPGRSVWWAVGGAPETQAAEWTAAEEAAEHPGPRVPGQGAPCPSLWER